MSLPVQFRPSAKRDVDAIYLELENARPGWGGRFKVRLNTLLERVESTPEMYAPIWRDVRAVLVKRFQYVVYYVVLKDQVEVLAVLHSARDASDWQSRVQS